MMYYDKDALFGAVYKYVKSGGKPLRKREGCSTLEKTSEHNTKITIVYDYYDRCHALIKIQINRNLLGKETQQSQPKYRNEIYSFLAPKILQKIKMEIERQLVAIKYRNS